MAVNLTKGQRISLEKEAGGKLARVVMGLGWDAKKKKGWFGSREQTIDLDASCLMFDDAGNVVDVVWFQQLRSKDGSIQHTGDNLTGEGEGDDEQIIVDLTRVPPNVKSLVFVVNSFTGQNFSEIENAFCRIVDERTGKEVAKFNLTGEGSYNAQVMAKVYRHGADWKMHAIGETGSGRTWNELIPIVKPHL